MPRISDIIEEFIKAKLDEANGDIEIQRNELAIYFKCAPSQINYVISTRFSNNQGYYVESRRGGGGHIKIRRAEISTSTLYLMHILSSVGDDISEQDVKVFIGNMLGSRLINVEESNIMMAATRDRALSKVPVVLKNKVRAEIFKNMLMSIRVS